MENKILSAIRRYEMIVPGETVICAVSGGADSMALLWSMWLLREKLGIAVEAAHFNHHLRGEESDRDEEFVRKFCAFHDIPLHVGGFPVQAGKKGLEAAARDARYGYLRSLGAKIATAHTAEDNAETVLMHLIRGTALRGLGGIAPKSDRLIRPMLDVTRAEVTEFLKENWIEHVEDSSNESDAFFRNRVRREILPLLAAENPMIGPNLSAMAQRLREEEQTLGELAELLDPTDVVALRKAPGCLRRRALERLLTDSGFPEPNASHIAQAEALVFAKSPSAWALFPGGVMLHREYDRLMGGQTPDALAEIPLPESGSLELPECGLRVCVSPEMPEPATEWCFPVFPAGPMVLRARREGDRISLPGGSKSVKKLFIDRKIPAARRNLVPIVADSQGILGICGIGADGKRTGKTAVWIKFEALSQEAPTENLKK